MATVSFRQKRQIRKSASFVNRIGSLHVDPCTGQAFFSKRCNQSCKGNHALTLALSELTGRLFGLHFSSTKVDPIE